ncbi:hypothetical protein FH508_0012380 [Lysinibacillus sp. CD3-6]|uniref:hypothetical protein n=1 Tax=unclassified Lysinibacillus TaxID=2636778 RepID=UPI00116EAC58|nr:hypothetical protein [Lysinibacillus sp. CD3-6]UED78264.1 hypothetical protein FH508_0012380 [Lysinibacillus sp. CD3-6]
MVKALAVSTIIISLLLWVPNIVFQKASTLWIFTFVLSGIGIVLAACVKSKILIIGNIITFFSFFILMFLGYIFVFLTK